MRISRIKNDKRAFTGLEAAIVLTAFVVVAAVFSYVVLNAGFFTTEKSKEVIHTGVSQATSSIELLGDVIAHGSAGKVTNVTFTLTLTAGKNPVDLTPGRTVISYMDKNHYKNNTNWSISWVGEQETADNILEFGEKAEITVNVTEFNLGTNTEFTLEVKPPEGASLTITRTTPSAIDAVMNLH